MLYSVKIDGNIYRLPLDPFYSEKLKYLVVDDIVILDNLSVDQLGEALDLLFSFVTMTLCALDLEHNSEELNAEKKEILKDMSSVDSLQKWLLKNNKKEKRNEVLKKYIERMLKYYNKSFEEDYMFSTR